MNNQLENQTVFTSVRPLNGPKGIKTSDVKRMKRTGLTTEAISKKLGVTPAAVSYHLAKKRKPNTSKKAEVRAAVNSVELVSFEADLFGTLIKLDRTPASIERIGNRITIK